eukprot:TRINITY_DN2001_c0_g1_i1.p1 TRINITY_DN2001_c0_g1~~TRINITY_DN2001_c0_g1_i1.p1  ORF type:complete len:479 (+),score=86.71 TRINITY_DN2001_c0_g1_i1:32-1468(+)
MLRHLFKIQRKYKSTSTHEATKLSIINPATGKVTSKIEADNEASVAHKFKLATSAQKNWLKVPIKERVSIMRKFGTLLLKHQQQLAETTTSETGKPIQQALNEIKGTINRVNWFCDNVEEVVKNDVVLKDGNQVTEVIEHKPLGIVANISAWNYPYFVGSNVFVPALLTGNSVLYKASEYSTLTGIRLVDLLLEAGIPAGTIVPVIGAGDIGAEILKHPVNGIFFTGSYATGVKISEAAAKNLCKVQLELGGKDPTYVHNDVDIKVAVESLADGAFYNTGQSCCSVERIYVHQSIYDNFVNQFVETVRSFKVGDPMSKETYIGPLTRPAQIAVLEEQVKDALSKGAKLQIGGKRIQKEGNFFEPTVFTEVNHSMELMREESFGPIIGIQRVADEIEGLSLMQDTQYGLTAGVYSKNEALAQNILSQINSGTVYWNCCDRVSVRLPWSGRKHSGVGVTLSKEGILTFTQPRAWHLSFPK